MGVNAVSSSMEDFEVGAEVEVQKHSVAAYSGPVQ